MQHGRAKVYVDLPDFAEGGPIPPQYTCEGEDVSPELNWMHPPEGTKSFALILDDPDAPSGLFTHWLLFDIESFADGLPKGNAKSGVPGRNDFEHVGYKGPCPPPRHGKHRYNFTVYALDVESLNLDKGASRQDMETAMQGRILQKAQLTGLYERR